MTRLSLLLTLSTLAGCHKDRAAYEEWQARKEACVRACETRGSDLRERVGNSCLCIRRTTTAFLVELDAGKAAIR